MAIMEEMWNELKRGEFSPSKWLEADLAELCTVRWCAAYLWGVGRDWSVWARARKRLEQFLSEEMDDALVVLQRVTWKKSEKNENREVFSVKWLGDEFNHVNLSVETTTTAYGNDACFYDVHQNWAVDSYSFEVHSLASSYPARDSD